MQSPEQKARMVREQVIAKIRWGTTDEEVINWLGTQHGISGAEARAMLAKAHASKRQAVREKAVIVVILSAIWTLGVVWYMWRESSANLWVFGPVQDLIMATGIVSLIFFVTNLAHVLTGSNQGSVD